MIRKTTAVVLHRRHVLFIATFVMLLVVAIGVVFLHRGPREATSTANDGAAPGIDDDAQRVAGRDRAGHRAGFRDAAQESGIDFHMSFLPNEQGENFKTNLYDHGCGVAIADYDGDGHDDVLFLNQLGPNALYRNKGDGTFDNVTSEAGPLALDDRIKVGAAFGDYDNDDDQDLYITSTRGGNVLLENVGGGRFRDVTDRAGVELVKHSQTPAFFDYDGDGYLDLFVTNTASWTGDKFDESSNYFPGPLTMLTEDFDRNWDENVLFRNDGDGTFTDVTREAGLSRPGWGGDVAAFDYDDDGDLDLLVTNMFGLSQLYRNDGRGHFDDVTREALRRTSMGATGCKAFDFDNDGRLDIFMVDMHSDMWIKLNDKIVVQPSRKFAKFMGPAVETSVADRMMEEALADRLALNYETVLFGNSLFHNDGAGQFSEVSDAAGMETWWPWGVAVGDFDNDGNEDAFLPSGMGYPWFYWPSSLMRNNGDGTFTDRAAEEGIKPPPDQQFLPERIGGKLAARSSRSAATADFDGDGRLDLMVGNFNDLPCYFKNRFPPRHYVAFRLRGTSSNHDAIGAVVKLFIGPKILVRQVHGTGGYLSQSSKTLHFGLGDNATVDRAEIRWPSGTRQVIESPSVDRLLEISEDESAGPLRTTSVPERVLGELGPAQSAFDGKEFDRNALLTPSAVTVAPGVHQLGAMSLSAVYVIETSAGLVLVDAGLAEDHGLLMEQMAELGLDPGQVRAILLTHAHGDHSLGAMPLKRKFGASIYAGRDDAQVLREGGPDEAIFSTYKMPGCKIHATDVDIELSGDEALVFGDTRIDVIAAPGHTPGSNCFVLNRGGLRIFFGGDTVMSSRTLGTYSTYLPPRYRGDTRAYLATVRKLSALPIPDILLPGHPRHDIIPRNARIQTAQWLSMLEHGSNELAELIERYETDGADFLDGEPKELLSGLHYLGDVDGCAVYMLATPSQLLLFNAPGGTGIPDWLDSRVRALGLGGRPLAAVLLTSCAPEDISGLPSLVEKTNCQVVSSQSGVAVLRDLGVPDATMLSADSLQAAGWIDVKTLLLDDFCPGGMGYVFQWGGKKILVTGRVALLCEADESATLERVLASPPEKIDAFRESLRRLLQLNPNLWLPTGPLEGRNANWYKDQWHDLLSYYISALRSN